MASEPHDYDDIPGTFVFDGEKSRQGYGINMFCMSLMKEESRKAFKANEVDYLKKFPLTPAQAKLGATDGHSFRHLAAVMTGSTQEDYAQMMLAGGRSVEGNRSKSGQEKPAKAAKSKPKSKPSKARSQRG
jgi:protocatechuate 4,5-dioxygenase, alpha chain